MNKQRINELAEDLYNAVFVMLDAEPEMSGEDSGSVAGKVEKAFKKVMEEYNEE